MSKNILIFSDGTGQIGGLKPDQRLSNVYKMYRAMRPGPSSPIKPDEQIAYYDAGLGAGETNGITYRKFMNMLEAAVGTGIDDNVIDCYEKIISYYEPGDKILLFGFSRGAYTVRALANVMNLCGIPTIMPDGKPVPKYGPKLRKVASDAVKYVYNHGTGYPRGEQPYFKQREEKGKRFRKKYKSAPTPPLEDVQGNVQPHFIGVFDTVAALGNSAITWIVRGVVFSLLLLMFAAYYFSLPSWVFFPVTLFLCFALFKYIGILISQFKYYAPDENKPLYFKNPSHWYQIWKNGHRAVWRKSNYDKWLDSEVSYARHALAIDEDRAEFPRVKWAMQAEQNKTFGRKPEWLKQVWFAGCHSDIGGSYPEDESRLSDIALDWMVSELKDCVPNVKINENMLVRNGNPKALQHQEEYLFKFWFVKIPWTRKPRYVDENAELHSSVIRRLESDKVPQVGEVKPYRPKQLEKHLELSDYYEN